MVEIHKNINVLDTPKLVGIAAGKAIESTILNLQKNQETIRVVFAAAPSQDTTLEYLVNSENINWHQIEAFNMDEYLDLPEEASQLFSKYLENNLFSKVKLKGQFTINPHSEVQEEIKRYSQLINEKPIDIVCLGIGENGHIAFNDPPIANFNDPETLILVELDEDCRKQQVNDGCFNSLVEVPKRALTLTIPALIKGGHLFCVVLGEKKSNAVKCTLQGPVSTACPASILTSHPNCNYFFDREAYSKITPV